MDMLKLAGLMIFSFVFGFGFWYLIFWFLTNEPNLFMWHWLTKTLYLVFSFSSLGGIIKGITE